MLHDTEAARQAHLTDDLRTFSELGIESEREADGRAIPICVNFHIHVYMRAPTHAIVRQTNAESSLYWGITSCRKVVQLGASRPGGFENGPWPVTQAAYVKLFSAL